ncbi:IS3 family transposase [Streptomyces sp. NPDC058872]|uniref:IS3 family transposase n=1 Tax=Streptomyces sp. NPDC058872 TaxID=3346661 RepID=UPI0036C6D950
MTGRWTFISVHRADFGVQRICRVLRVSRSGFYRWLAGAEARAVRRAADDAQVAEIRAIHAGHRGTYGVRRVHAELRGFGHTVNRKRVERLMRREGIEGRHLRRRKRTTVPDRLAPPVPADLEANRRAHGSTRSPGIGQLAGEAHRCIVTRGSRSEVMTHHRPQGPQQTPDLRLGPEGSAHRLPGFGLFPFQAFDLAVHPVQGLVDLARRCEHFVRGDHLRAGVRIAMGSFGLVQFRPVGLLDPAFLHGVQELPECRGELTCVPIELHVAGASEEEVLADLRMVPKQFYLPTFRPFRGALSQQGSSQGSCHACHRDDHRAEIHSTPEAVLQSTGHVLVVLHTRR